MMAFSYIFAIFFILGSLISNLRLPVWWVKVWDVSRLYAGIFLIIALLLLVFEVSEHWSKWILVLLCLSLAIYNFYLISPFTPFHAKEVPDAAAKTNARTYKFAAANVRMSNSDYRSLVQMIGDVDPDVLLLTEVNKDWITGVAALENAYPHKVLNPLDNTYGIALYSKLPLKNCEVKYLVDPNVPSIHTHLLDTKTDTEFQYIGMHPKPPSPSNKSVEKDIELIKVAGITNHNLLPTIVSGDLNDVGWSKATRNFKVISKMLDPRVGRGLFNTYNALIPVFRFPIDHFFLSKHFQLVCMRRLPKFGSDHFSVLIEVVVNK